LKRQRHVDRGTALIDGKSYIDAGRYARADTRDTAPSLAVIADIDALCAGRGRDAVGLTPSAKLRALCGFRGAAAAWVGSRVAIEAARRLVSKSLEVTANEIRRCGARRHVGIDIGWYRQWRRWRRRSRSNLRLCQR